jgi:hypothetical protein
MEAPRGDVALARAGVSGADASSCQDGDLAARMAKTRRELKVWETEFATAHGRAPNKDDAALASGVKEMYGLYRSLKGKLDKENAVAGTEIGPGGVKQAEASAARSPRGAPLVDAARGRVGSRAFRRARETQQWRLAFQDSQPTAAMTMTTTWWMRRR